MASNRIGTLQILILVILLLPLAYIGIQYYSITSARVSVANPSLNLGVTDFLQLSSLADILLSREIEGEFDLIIEGRGLLSATVKNLEVKIFLEDVYMGIASSDTFFKIPSSGIESVHMNFKFDLSSVSLSDVQTVAQSIVSHNGEVKLSLEGFYEPVLLVFPLTLNIQATSYTPTISNAPKVVSLSWDAEECEVGDEVGYDVSVKNVFRASSIEGYVDVLIREDVSWAQDITADNRRFLVSLNPGETDSYSGSFETYKESSTKGFFIKAQWGSNVLAEQSSAYPPRLGVIEGVLGIESVYWEVDGEAVSSCEVGDQVRAHIILRALDARVEDRITISIRKDIPLWTDTDVITSDFLVSLEQGELKECVLSFIPDESSDSNLRGYFVEIEGFTSWTMPSDYPPRLNVGEEQLGTPVVLNAWWTTPSGVVNSVSQGDHVTGHILYEASGGEVNSQLLIHVRRDLALQSDQDLVTFSRTLSLLDGQQKELTFSYDASDSPGTSFRGYFLQVDYTSIGETWTMDNSYPPRLIVTEEVEEPEQPSTPETPEEPEQPREGTPSIVDVWWTVNDQIVTSCQQDQIVIANVKIIANGGSVSGTIAVHVRKDIPYLPDEDHVTQSFSVSFSEGQSGVATVTFVAAQKTGWTFRGYFIQVDFDSWGTSWTMVSEYPPRLNVQ